MAFSKSVVQAQTILLCQLCETDPKIKWKCVDCQLLMCTKCRDRIHPKFKNAEEHEVLDLKEVRSQEEISTERIKVSKLPDNVTEDEIKYFFENRKRSGGRDVDTVDYDQKTNTAIVIFRDEEDVQKVLDKCPLLFNEKVIRVEKYFIDETHYNECTIEVTGMNQNTSKRNVMLYFESKKGASDDVLSIIYVEEQEMYLVRFMSEDVVDAILKKKHVLDGSELQVRKHIPLPPEATYQNQVSVSGFDAKIAEEVLINFLEARSKIDVDKVVYGDIEGTAIVIFKTQLDVSKLQEECKKKLLNGRYVKVESLPLTKCNIVSGIKDVTTEDAIMYHFDNMKKSGVEGVYGVELDSKNRTCLGYFDDSDEETSTKRIKVSKLPDKVTEDEIKYFFENRKRSGGSDVDTVDYDQKTNTAIVIFQDEEDVQKVLDKCPLLFYEKHIEVEEYIIDEEPDETQYNECTIEVTGMNQNTSKNNVMLYFESKKGASEDVKSIIYVEEQEMFLVRFSSEDVVDAVLKKKHVLYGSELQVRKHIPIPPEVTYPKQISVSGFDDKITEEILIHFLEARSKADVDKVVYGDIEGTAIVIFKTQPDVGKLKEECKKKLLNGRYVKVDSVPLTKCIIVSSIKDGTTEDEIMYYFDNERKSGVEGVDDVELDSKNRTCIVYFVDSDAPVAACKREHTIGGGKIKVDFYYEVIGGTGSELMFIPPDPIDLVLDAKSIQFLTNSKTGQNELEQQLKAYNARVKRWPSMKTATLKIECTITADIMDCNKLVKNWETNVNKCVDKVMNNLYERNTRRFKRNENQ